MVRHLHFLDSLPSWNPHLLPLDCSLVDLWISRWSSLWQQRLKAHFSMKVIVASSLLQGSWLLLWWPFSRLQPLIPHWIETFWLCSAAISMSFAFEKYFWRYSSSFFGTGRSSSHFTNSNSCFSKEFFNLIYQWVLVILFSTWLTSLQTGRASSFWAILLCFWTLSPNVTPAQQTV